MGAIFPNYSIDVLLNELIHDDEFSIQKYSRESCKGHLDYRLRRSLQLCSYIKSVFYNVGQLHYINTISWNITSLARKMFSLKAFEDLFVLKSSKETMGKNSCPKKNYKIHSNERNFKIKVGVLFLHGKTLLEAHPWLSHWLIYVCLVAQLCPTLCNYMDCSLPGFSVHGDSPDKNTGVGCQSILQGIFPTQGSNPGLLLCRLILYHLSHQGNPD